MNSVNPEAAPPSPTVTLSQRLLTPEECFWLEQQRQALPKSLDRLNDHLKQLVSVAGTLSGGSLLLLKEDICSPMFRLPAVILFLIAMLVALRGFLPFTVNVPTMSPMAMRDSMMAATAWKSRMVWWSLGILLAGFATAIAGSIVATIP